MVMIQLSLLLIVGGLPLLRVDIARAFHAGTVGVDGLAPGLVYWHKEIFDRYPLFEQPLLVGISNNHVQYFFIAFDAVLPRISAHDRALFFPNLAIPSKVRVSRIGIVSQCQLLGFIAGIEHFHRSIRIFIQVSFVKGNRVARWKYAGPAVE